MIKKSSTKSGHRRFSKLVTESNARAASRGMLYGVGFKKGDFQKSQVGVASTWGNVTPCNMHINDLAEHTARGVRRAKGMPLIFGTITVSDGISMGTEGMKYSLVSREVIADSIETVVGCQCYDGLVAIGGCDKNMPGCLIAIARLNRPAVFVYGGTILPGRYKGSDVDIVSIFEAVGKEAAGKITQAELDEVESCAIPGAGSCGGMYTANTMASAIEALGMSLPNSSSQEAVSKEKVLDCVEAGEAVLHLIERNICPLDIITREAFENAITVVMVLGGSTNAVLHLLAMAHAAKVELELDDFLRIGEKTPVLADLKPSGKYLMTDFIKIGGLPPLMKMLLEEGLIHGDCMTVTGKTVRENLEKVTHYKKNQKIVHTILDPIKKTGHLVVLRGNLAKDGAVAKISGKEGEYFKGTARVFNSEEEALEKILDGTVVRGDVIVIRYEGPKGGPGMREMLSPTSAIMGRGLGKDVALITDGRFSGGSHGFVIGHITPEAQDGGLIAIVENGDKITIDIINRKIDLELSEEEVKNRQEKLIIPKVRYNRGVLAKYSKTVSSASLGAVTDLN